MAFTLSPNMFLRVPGVGSEAGPDYAIDVNYDLLSILDVHDHTPGRGVQITPAGLNINVALPFNNNFASGVAGITFDAQSITPSLGTIYQSVNDLFYVDGVGNNIRITQSGGVAGTPGSISNLTAPASVNYVAGSQTFVFQSNVNIAANLDAGSLLLRNLSPNSTHAITVSPPAALATNYSLTLPLLPSQQSFMTLDQFGAMAAPWTVDGTSIKIVANQITADGANIPNSDREHAWELNGNYPSLTFPLDNIDSEFLAPYNLNITSVWIYSGTAGASGTTEFDLLVKDPGGSYASILSTTGKIDSTAASDIYTDSGSVVGAQTGVVKPVIGTSSINAGQAIKWNLVQSMDAPAADARIRIFYRQT